MPEYYRKVLLATGGTENLASPRLRRARARKLLERQVEEVRVAG